MAHVTRIGSQAQMPHSGLSNFHAGKGGSGQQRYVSVDRDLFAIYLLGVTVSAASWMPVL